MKREPVTSSNIKSVGFESGTLEVEFLNGNIYVYSAVPEYKYEALLAASSPGKYLNAHIIGKHIHEKIR